MFNFSYNKNKLLFSLGLGFYQKTQKYGLNYSVSIQNLAQKTNNISIILPVATNLKQQKIRQNPVFNLEPNVTGTEPLYENKYVIFKLEMEPNGSREISEKFEAEIEPLESNPEDQKVTDYPENAEVKKYLQTNSILKPNREIEELAKLISKDKSLAVILEEINVLIINKLHYGDPISGLYSATQAISCQKTDCGGYATLFVSVCQILGIPARVVSGFFSGYHVNEMHAWVEILMPDGQWIPADPAIEQLFVQGRTKKYGKLGFVGSDRIIFSVGCGLEVDGRTIDILQNPTVEASLGQGSFEMTLKVESTKK